jgi:hypothetical protein
MPELDLSAIDVTREYALVVGAEGMLPFINETTSGVLEDTKSYDGTLDILLKETNVDAGIGSTVGEIDVWGDVDVAQTVTSRCVERDTAVDAAVIGPIELATPWEVFVGIAVITHHFEDILSVEADVRGDVHAKGSVAGIKMLTDLLAVDKDGCIMIDTIEVQAKLTPLHVGRKWKDSAIPCFAGIVFESRHDVVCVGYGDCGLGCLDRQPELPLAVETDGLLSECQHWKKG